MARTRPLPGQKVLLCGLNCKPGQEDLFPTDGPPDPDDAVEGVDGNGGDEGTAADATCNTGIAESENR